MEISLNSILLSFQTPICFWFYYTASTFLMEQALTGEIELQLGFWEFPQKPAIL